MPVCSYPGPGGCKEYAMKGNVRCEAHLIKNASDRKAESAHVQKLIRTEEAAALNKAERAARDMKAQQAAEAYENLKALRAEVIRTHKALWSAQVADIVAEVEVLRVNDPNANAGQNPGGTTAGGVDNPLTLTFSGPTHGLGKGDVTRGMTGFDSSDKGVFKFRRSGVFVHCC